jgi:hypothetical protein
VALLSTPAGEVSEQIAECLPDRGAIDMLAIARRHPGARAELAREVDRDVFAERARLARGSHDLSLEATITDLAGEKTKLMHSPFDPPVPKGLTLHERLVTVRDAISGDLVEGVRRSLLGTARRQQLNGLGFDYQRIPAGIQADADVWVDPLLELLCFYGMLLLPVRGNGSVAIARGWSEAPLSRGAFAWPVWAPNLDCWATDALLDIVWLGPDPNVMRRWGVTGMYASVALQPRSSTDVRRGYASERRW